MRIYLALFSIGMLTACVTPASREALQLEPFVMTEAGWRAESDPVPDPFARPLAVGENYATLEDMVEAAQLYGKAIDVAVDQRFNKLTVTMQADGYADDSIAAEKYVVQAVTLNSGFRAVDIEHFRKCRRAATGGWVTSPCP
ncbi:hypothetical protein [Parvularcula sp. LCG005]|uniref:hypothetical protein n=1 Tax=Parvularcula sp. LCG005 TaxID=3078805 RepID=UPI002943F6E9|nr:hypothetical protein [Parvularcula sp. LCG005]WOI54614.1 hypothetical protein RUI03_06345 [Parvularcula sp. LCG005]